MSQDDNTLQALIASVHLLNCKVLKLYREKSLTSISGRTTEYRDNVVKDRVLEFLHQDKDKSSDLQDQIPNIKVYGLRDFRKFINKE